MGLATINKSIRAFNNKNSGKVGQTELGMMDAPRESKVDRPMIKMVISLMNRDFINDVFCLSRPKQGLNTPQAIL